jgi:hypothetical protein
MDHFSPLKFIHFYSFALLCVYRAKQRLIPENENLSRKLVWDKKQNMGPYFYRAKRKVLIFILANQGLPRGLTKFWVYYKTNKHKQQNKQQTYKFERLKWITLRIHLEVNIALFAMNTQLIGVSARVDIEFVAMIVL